MSEQQIPQNKSSDTFPLVVDLDGTVIKTDLFFEGTVELLKKDFLAFLKLLLILLTKGIAAGKYFLAERVDLDWQTIPLSTHFFDYLIHEKKSGRKIILASASTKKWVEGYASHLNQFDEIIASTESFNCKSANKLAKIKELLKEQPFEYAGNGLADLAIWQEAEEITLVNASDSVVSKARKIKDPKYLFNQQYVKLDEALLKAIRPHQWSKNLLVFLPIILAHQFLDISKLAQVVLGFLVFSFAASAIYLVNDIWDLNSDRCHASKRSRAIASGNLSIPLAVGIAGVLIGFSMLLASQLPLNFLLIILVYIAITLSYSFFLKRVIILDIVVLSLLYSIRIFAGGAVAGITVTFWLMAFSLFFFFGLAALKRYIELLKVINPSEQVRGRGYLAQDVPIVLLSGVSSGLISVLVLALYINNPELQSLYHHGELIWLLCPILLYWVVRIWILTNRHVVSDDPVQFAVKDKVTYLVGLLIVIILLLAK